MDQSSKYLKIFVLDLDHTLIHTILKHHIAPNELHQLQIQNQRSKIAFPMSDHILSLRPYTCSALNTLKSEGNLIMVYTHASETYARNVCENLDPHKQIFEWNNGIIATPDQEANDHTKKRQLKNLDKLISQYMKTHPQKRSCQLQVIILDDNCDAWRLKDWKYIFQINPYIHWWNYCFAPNDIARFLPKRPQQQYYYHQCYNQWVELFKKPEQERKFSQDSGTQLLQIGDSQSGGSISDNLLMENTLNYSVNTNFFEPIVKYISSIVDPVYLDLRSKSILHRKDSDDFSKMKNSGVDKNLIEMVTPHTTSNGSSDSQNNPKNTQKEIQFMEILDTVECLCSDANNHVSFECDYDYRKKYELYYKTVFSKFMENNYQMYIKGDCYFVATKNDCNNSSSDQMIDWMVADNIEEFTSNIHLIIQCLHGHWCRKSMTLQTFVDCLVNVKLENYKCPIPISPILTPANP